MGIFSLTSICVDRAAADIWVGHRKVMSVDLGRPIPERWQNLVAAQDEVKRTEVYLQAFVYADQLDRVSPPLLAGAPAGEKSGSQLCTIIGTQLDGGSLGAVAELSEDLRSLLSEPLAIVVDESELDRLGIREQWERDGQAQLVMVKQRVRVVGTMKGLPSLAGPYVFCSLETARRLLPIRHNEAIYVLAQCHDPADAARVAERLNRAFPEMRAFTKDDFSFRTRWYWLVATKTGVAMGFAAALGLLVGVVVTSQTLYAATAAAQREYAVLQAMGIPRRRMMASVLAQSLWVGLFGVVVALPLAFAIQGTAGTVGARILLPEWLLASASAVTILMALVSGVAALRSLRLAEPASLLR